MLVGESISIYIASLTRSPQDGGAGCFPKPGDQPGVL